MAERPLVIGLGNRLRGDDAAGLRVAERLGERGIETIPHEGEPIDLLELWSGRDHVLVVDAVAGHRPGRMRRLDPRSRLLPEILGGPASTHMLGLAEVIALARQLARLPTRLRVIGVEGERFGLGAKPSPAVEAAIEALVSELASELSDSVVSTGRASC